MQLRLSSRWWYTLSISVLTVVVLLLFADPAMAEEGEEGGSNKNVYVHILKSAGPFLIVLAVPSLALIALIILLFLDLRTSNAIPKGFVDEFVDIVNKRRFKEAFDMARNDTSFLGRVLTAGMSRLQYGLEDAREASINMLESIRSGKEQFNNYIAVIGSLGPLIGLVGTVLGMIRAFIVLADGGAINAAKLSEGISEALSITFLGIGLALPAIFFNAFFRNRIISISMDTGNIADDLLTQMYHNSKKGGPTPSGTTSAPPSAPPPPPPPPK